MFRKKHSLNVLFLVVFIAVSIVPAYAQEVPAEEATPAIPVVELQEVVVQEDQTQEEDDTSLPELLPEIPIPVDSDTVTAQPDETEQGTSTVVTSLPDSLIVQTLASSSLNKDLPFELTSTDMVFAINEIPSFSFVSKNAEGSIEKKEGFVATIIDTVVEKITDVYTGSVVETIVDTVADTFETALDFLLPTAEAEESTTEIEAIDAVSSEEASPLIVESPNSEAPEEEITQTEDTPSTQEASSVLTDIVPDETAIDIDIEDVSISLSPTFATSSEDGVEIINAAAPVVLRHFAIVDGVTLPVHVTFYDTGTFDVTFIGGVFDVGEHALELHIIYDGREYRAYYIFSIEGTVVSMKPLNQNTFATVVADQLGMQTLWLQEMASGSVYSFEKIADQTLMAQNPVLEFVEGVLFFTTPQREVLMGFDIVSKSQFSQTLNTNSNQDDRIELKSEEYDVQIGTDVILIEFVPEAKRI